MKKFILSLCFAAFLSGGLVSCADEAAEITPNHSLVVDPLSESNDPVGTQPPIKP